MCQQRTIVIKRIKPKVEVSCTRAANLVRSL
jgi:hypothetical protein